MSKNARYIKPALMLAVAAACLGAAALILLQQQSGHPDGVDREPRVTPPPEPTAADDLMPPALASPAAQVTMPTEATEAEVRVQPLTLREAIRAGHVEQVMQLLGELPSPDKSDPYKDTPLALAVYYGNQQLVVAIVEAGADVNHRSAVGWTPLMHAAARGDLAMVRWLLGRGADPDLVNDADRRAEELANDKGHLEVASVLAQVSRPDGRALIDMASAYSTRPEELRQYLAEGADPNGVDQYGRTALYYMLTRRYRDFFRGEQYSLNFDEALQVQRFVGCVQVLIHAGADPNAVDKQGRPLLVAWLEDARGRTPPGVIRAMMEGGADPQQADARGRTALTVLAEEGQATRDLFGPLLNADR